MIVWLLSTCVLLTNAFIIIRYPTPAPPPLPGHGKLNAVENEENNQKCGANLIYGQPRMGLKPISEIDRVIPFDHSWVPFVVTLYRNSETATGTLISPRHVLTGSRIIPRLFEGYCDLIANYQFGRKEIEGTRIAFTNDPSRGERVVSATGVHYCQPYGNLPGYIIMELARNITSPHYIPICLGDVGLHPTSRYITAAHPAQLNERWLERPVACHGEPWENITRVQCYRPSAPLCMEEYGGATIAGFETDVRHTASGLVLYQERNQDSATTCLWEPKYDRIVVTRLANELYNICSLTGVCPK